MGEEMQDFRQPDWRKAISEDRDRMQSRWLVGVVGSLLVGWSGWTLYLALPMARQFPAFILGAIAISVAFAGVVLALKAATPAGAMCGGMICLILTYWTGAYHDSVARTALTPLAALFVLTFLATRAGKLRKVMAGLAEGKRGRTAAQVIANLGFSALCVNSWMYIAVLWGFSRCCDSGIGNVWVEWILEVMCLAALVEATADTVSSEIGQAYGGQPVLLVGMKRVAPGTDGAVSVLGTCAGIAAGVVVASVGVWAMHLHAKEALVAVGGGTLGLFFDSLLGATVERRGWIGNDLVNFTSTVFAAVTAALAYRYLVF